MNAEVEQILKQLLNIEKQYLRAEKKERLSDVPLRTLGWKRKTSTKFDIPFSPWHREKALVIIIDLIEMYNLTPVKILSELPPVFFILKFARQLTL